jgi:3-oxoacyl-[acyl-carrier-protein] synthase-1
MTGSDKLPLVAFTGSGLVCSLGFDVRTACAAMRAGIVRPSTVDTFVVGDLDDSGGATVHAAPLITHGLEGDARLLRLLQAALADLQSQHPEAPWKDAHTGFYLSIPDPDRVHTGHALIPDEELREQEIEKFKQLQTERSTPLDVKDRAQQLLERSARLAGWTNPVMLQRVSTAGHTGVAELIEFAWRDLGAEIVELAIVGGVDSWIDEASLLWLERRTRLKSPAMPIGLPPGEASGFLLIETDSHAKARRARPLAALQAVILEQDTHPQLTAESSTGEALARILSRTAALAGWSPEPPPWLVVDQNGESYRAMEWGYALSRLIQGHPAFQQPTLWYPVASVGDTGAATGVIQASMALQAFVRDYAPARRVALLSSAEAGQRACMLLEAGIG